jgi:hypothetical protein
MTSRYLPRTLVALAAALCLAGAATTIAQAPAGAPPQGMRGPRGPRPAPTNIKALPKNISGDDLIKLMHQYEGDLGVECNYCHAKNADTGRTDFASDANPMKDRARVMIRMNAAINADFLTQLTDPKAANPVTCGTCHQGMSKPAVFVPKPQGPRPAPPAGAPPK